MPSWGMDQQPFLIAGGGIAGLAAGLALAKNRRSSRIFEQAPAFEEVGAGLQMSPNGVSALRWLGAWEAIENSCVIPTELHVRNGLSGAILQRVRFGKSFEQRFGAPYRVAHRADLLNALLATARTSGCIELNTGAAVTAAASTAGGASLTLNNVRTANGPAVIAADGIESRLRQQIWPASRPVFRGQAIYRALIPFEHVPPAIAADCVTLWLYPGGHVVHYAVSNWRRFNIVAVLSSRRRDASAAADVKYAFADATDDLAALLAAPSGWSQWIAADIEPLATWVSGNIVLTGDAAHATLPYLAQGAVMSLEDACVLGSCISIAPVNEAFESYQAARLLRTQRIQSESRRLAKTYGARGTLAFIRNRVMSLMGKNFTLNRYAWIYDWQTP